MALLDKRVWESTQRERERKNWRKTNQMINYSESVDIRSPPHHRACPIRNEAFQLDLHQTTFLDQKSANLQTFVCLDLYVFVYVFFLFLWFQVFTGNQSRIHRSKKTHLPYWFSLQELFGILSALRLIHFPVKEDWEPRDKSSLLDSTNTWKENVYFETVKPFYSCKRTTKISVFLMNFTRCLELDLNWFKKIQLLWVSS